MEISALKEVGYLRVFLTSLSQMTGLTINYSIPYCYGYGWSHTLGASEWQGDSAFIETNFLG